MLQADNGFLRLRGVRFKKQLPDANREENLRGPTAWQEPACCIFFQRRLGSDRKQCFPIAFDSLALHSSKKWRMRHHTFSF